MENRTTFNNFINDNLNVEQKKAVVQKNGIFVVCAGAGSGKTRVITARITNLILNEQIPSNAVVALTFTNKAANEMKERVQHFLPATLQTPYVGTFHAYCVRLLKAHQHLLQHQQFTILDDDDQKTLLHKIITAQGLQKKVTAKNASYAISKAKNASLTGAVNPTEFGDQFMRELFMLYEQEKQRAHCFDFDDLLLETLVLFKKNEHFRKNYQKTIRHVLVDEYQDTNHVQHALLKAMTCDETNMFCLDSLCVVGDEDQSIYSWRGATVHNIVNFKHDFPATNLITIEQNYRSAQPILEAANSVIRHNKLRNPKNLWSTRTGSDRIRVVQTASEYQEADFIAQAARATFKRDAKSCAVLYRSHYQSRAIEEVLIRQSIPYTIIGGIQFYERQEIKDLLAYMRLVVNPFDRVSFMRVINTPARGLGDKFEELFFDTWQYEPFLSFDLVARHIIDKELVTGIKQIKLKEFLDLFIGMSANDKASVVLANIINKTAYFQYLIKAFEQQEANSKIENVKELMSAIQSLEEQGLVSVRDFLDEVALLQDHAKKSKDNESNCLFLMTLHAAKGLEFDTVILVGLEDGIFPSARSIYETEALEEERRLLYVGITRAREHLLITCAQQRYVFGTLTTQMPSRFLREIPDAVTCCDDGRHWRGFEIQAYITNWFAGTKHAKNITPATSASTMAFEWDKDPFAEAAPAVKKEKVVEKRWKKLQPVHHKTFGTGIIQEIEEKDAGAKVNLTIKFSDGIKKIDAKFVEIV